MSDDNAGVTLWFTEMCPNCDNAVMVCDGDTEICDSCGYSRIVDRPLYGDEAWNGEGLA